MSKIHFIQEVDNGGWDKKSLSQHYFDDIFPITDKIRQNLKIRKLLITLKTIFSFQFIIKQKKHFFSLRTYYPKAFLFIQLDF